MRLSRIYTAQALHSGAAVVLEDEVAHYIGKVLRMRPGEQVALFNGRDGEHLAEVSQVDKRTVTVQLLEVREVSGRSAAAHSPGAGPVPR
jgi:16S rRNA (uracil1498-N3)-methyltransferase